MERFLVDQMLMRLGRWLRLVGTDVANPGDDDDQGLLVRAGREDRVLVTRDKRLAERCEASGVECILIRSTDLPGQLNEMAEAGIKMELNPKRCTICNGLLRRADGRAGSQSLQEPTWECEACGKLYWEGSHWKGIGNTLGQISSGRTKARERDHKTCNAE